MQSTIDDFQRYGGPGAAVGVLIASGDQHATASADLAARLRACGGFFFTGGDQSRIVDTFRPGQTTSLAYESIRERHQQGAFIAGTSAGAAMMSDPMIGGGDSLLALSHGVCHEDGCPGVWLRDGMGFWSGWITDQHFLARGRVGRLLTALLEASDGPRLGLGVDEDTAVIVDGELAEVVGRSGAMIINAATADRREAGWSGITMTLYGPGDRFRLSDQALVERGAALRERGAEPPTALGPELAFEGWNFARSLIAIGGQQAPAPVTLRGEGWTIVVTPHADFSAGALVGPHAVGFVGPFLLDVSLPRP